MAVSQLHSAYFVDYLLLISCLFCYCLEIHYYMKFIYLVRVENNAKESGKNWRGGSNLPMIEENAGRI